MPRPLYIVDTIGGLFEQFPLPPIDPSWVQPGPNGQLPSWVPPGVLPPSVTPAAPAPEARAWYREPIVIAAGIAVAGMLVVLAVKR